MDQWKEHSRGYYTEQAAVAEAAGLKVSRVAAIGNGEWAIMVPDHSLYPKTRWDVV